MCRFVAYISKDVAITTEGFIPPRGVDVSNSTDELGNFVDVATGTDELVVLVDVASEHDPPSPSSPECSLLSREHLSLSLRDHYNTYAGTN